MTANVPGAKLLLHLHHAEIKRPMAYFALLVGDHETRSSQYDKETHPIFDTKLEFDLSGWWKPKAVSFEMFKKNQILKDSPVGGFHTTVADLLYMAGLSDDVGPAGIPSIKVTRTPDQPSNIKFWMDLSVKESNDETVTGRICLSLEIVNTKYIFTPDEEVLAVIQLPGPKKPDLEKKVSEPIESPKDVPPALKSQSLSDLTSQKPVMTAEEAAAALLSQKAAAEPPPVVTAESLAQDWWRSLSFDAKFIYAMTLHKKAANQLAKAEAKAEIIKSIVPDPNTAPTAQLFIANTYAHAAAGNPFVQDPRFQRLNNPEAYTFAMWWFALGLATILIGTYPIPIFPDYDIITQFCNLLYAGGIVGLGVIFGYAQDFRKIDVAAACLIGVTTGMVCDYESDSIITSILVVACLAAGNGYPRAEVPLLPEFFTHPPPYHPQPGVLIAQGSQPHLIQQGSQPHLIQQGSQPHLVPQGSQQVLTPTGPAQLTSQNSQPQLIYIPPPKEQKVFKLNVTTEQVLAVIRYSMNEAWAGRSTDGVLHYCNRGVAFGIGLLVGKFLMSGLYDMHGILYCAIMGVASAASPVIMGRKKTHVS